jgi:two-component system, sensor histidine kinase PdtaS
MQDHDLDDLRRLFSLLIDSVPIGVAVIDREMRLQYINERQAKLNNIPVSEHIGRKVSDVLPRLFSVAGSKIQFVLDTGTPLLKQEIISGQASGAGYTLHRLASYFPWRAGNGEIKGVLAVVQDATVDSFTRQLQEDSQQRLLDVLDNLFTFVGVMEVDGTLTDANKAPLEAAGLCLDDVRGKKFWDTYWWSHDVEAQNKLRDAGNITHLIPSASDITERHANAVALQQAEERAQSIIESSDDAIITKSLDGIITEWNTAATRMLGYSAQEAIGRPVTLIFPLDKLAEEESVMRAISQGQRVPSFETVRIHKSGYLIDVAVTVSPLRDRSGRVIGACKLARDITVQKRQRDAIDHALEEKTALLHEVHHRVKNNLQIVSSLLNLQARKASPDVVLALAECQGRIRAMGLVHQLLYESENMVEVDLSVYISRLIMLTKETYEGPASGVELVFSGVQEKLALDIQRTIPCGLVVHELVLNAFKHAFPGGRQGRINVELRLVSSGFLHLTVRDNGCGLPESFTWGGKSGLGTQLIPMFVNQLQGTMTTASSSHGASITIELVPAKQKVQDAS